MTTASDPMPIEPGVAPMVSDRICESGWLTIDPPPAIISMLPPGESIDAPEALRMAIPCRSPAPRVIWPAAEPPLEIVPLFLIDVLPHERGLTVPLVGLDGSRSCPSIFKWTFSPIRLISTSLSPVLIEISGASTLAPDLTRIALFLLPPTKWSSCASQEEPEWNLIRF